jgi:hypothetical protein
MFPLSKTFSKDECGAIAVDWLLLTATAIGLAVGVLTMLQTGDTKLSDTKSEATLHSP